MTSVTAVAVVRPLKRALAPLAGAVNVTVTPDTGLLAASRTVACSAVVNALLISMLCGVPAVAVTLAAAPAVLLRLKLAGMGMPGADAVTV